VERCIYFLCKRSAYSRDFGDFFNTGTFNLFQSAEMTEQFSPALGPYAWYLFQFRLTTSLAALGAMTRDGKTV
jgi:hypothetical protein